MTIGAASATEYPLIVQQHIEVEWARGSLVGPLPPSLTDTVHLSPLGLVPKPHSVKWQLIVNLYSPEGYSVNDGICQDLTSMVYTSVDNAVEIVRRLGRGMDYGGSKGGPGGARLPDLLYTHTLIRLSCSYIN